MASGLVTGFAGRLAGRRICVAGLGVSGPPAARVLTTLGAEVVAVDARDDTERRELAAVLEAGGIGVRLGVTLASILPEGTDLVVTSPGWQPDAALLVAAAAAGIEVMGDTELAWRLRPMLPDGREQPWLAVTGTNGKTTTVRMLALMLAAAGCRSIAAGNVGTSLIDVVTEPEAYEVVAVELSSLQLHWSSSVRPLAAAVLNVAGHHLDWHGDLEAYAAAKARIFAPGTIAIGNADDQRSSAMAAAAGASGAAGRAVLYRLGEPGPGELGVAEGFLIDRAFSDPTAGAAGQDRAGPADAGEGVRLAEVSDLAMPDPSGPARASHPGVRDHGEPVAGNRPAAPHTVADALAAAALARAYGVPAAAVRAGLRRFRPAPHRVWLVGTVGVVDFVDDSKATNPHAAAASLGSFGSVVWVAGCQLKSAESDLDALVKGAAPRLRGVVLLGADRDKIGAALARHAPRVPVVEASGTDTGVMDLVVAKAAGLAEPGDTVLLAPAAQSFDMFRDYPARGEAFAAAVRRLAAGR